MICVAARRGADRERRRVPVHDPDVPEPDRPDAVQGAPQAARRACPRRIARARGRSVRPRPLRGQAAADGVRAGPRRERRLQLVLLEDGRARGCASATSCCRARWPNGSWRPRPPPTSRRRCSRRRSSTSSCAAGRFEPNLERICGLLRERRDAMIGALERHLPEATWTVPEGGYFVWLDLPDGIAAADLRAEGRHVRPRLGLLLRAGWRERATARLQLRVAVLRSRRASAAWPQPSAPRSC